MKITTVQDTGSKLENHSSNQQIREDQWQNLRESLKESEIVSYAEQGLNG